MNKKILNLALPNIISNISVPLLGMVDVAIVGHLGSDSLIGAIAVAGIIFSFVYWNLGFLRMGTSGFTAQAYGARNLRESFDILMRALSIGALLAVIILLLQMPIAWLGFQIIEATPTVVEPALQYFFIRIWAAPCNLLLYGFNGWYIGMQNAKFPMYITLVINIFNIIVSFVLVFYFDMGITGVAYGTVFAQYLGLSTAILLWAIYYRKLLKFFSVQNIFDLPKIINFFKVNGDIFLRSFCMVMVFCSFTAYSSKYGDTILAVNTLLNQLFLLFSYIMDGFAYAAEALTGRYIGAKDQRSLQKMIRTLFKWGWILTALFTVLYIFFDDQLLSILTDSKTVLSAAKEYLYWIILIPICGFGAFLWDGIYIGATASKAMRNIVFIGTIGYFGTYYLLIYCFSLGNHALWASLIVFLLIRGLGMRFSATRTIFRQD